MVQLYGYSYMVRRSVPKETQDRLRQGMPPHSGKVSKSVYRKTKRSYSDEGIASSLLRWTGEAPLGPAINSMRVQ